jgi:hypothetical protein
VSKGSRNRTTNHAAYRRNYDRIRWGKKTKGKAKR